MHPICGFATCMHMYMFHIISMREYLIILEDNTQLR